MRTYKKLFALLGSNDRKRLRWLVILVILMSVFDTLGVASILPFMTVLASPDLVESNPLLVYLYGIGVAFGFISVQSFLVLLGSFVFFLLIASLSLKALSVYATTNFTHLCEYGLARRLAEGYLKQPYIWFLERHSADLGRAVLSEVGLVVNGSLMHAVNLLVHLVTTFMLLTLLILLDPFLAFVVGLCISLVFGIVYLATSGLLLRMGKGRILANEKRFLALSDAFVAIKEVKLRGLENTYVERFAEPALIFAKLQAAAYAIGQLPRYALEAAAFGGMLLVVLYLLMKTGNFNSALPIVAVYAFAGYRLMPAIQQIYNGVAQLRYSGPALDKLYDDWMETSSVSPNLCSPNRLDLEESIELTGVHYNYPNASNPALKGLNLVIKSKSTVGLVGLTGSGKTTTVDLIMGLLEAQEGTLKVDGQLISQANVKHWQASIGYVPQQIFLADSSISSNIAFGVPANDVDQDSLIEASKIAKLHDFVINDTPNKYDTVVGESGVRLSGGQRQRIGIARALYHRPKILVFDEATSALDNLTEQAVMEAVNNLDQQMTIILIAHRLSTVKECDEIFLLSDGEVLEQGSYEELMKNSAEFRSLVFKRNEL